MKIRGLMMAGTMVISAIVGLSACESSGKGEQVGGNGATGGGGAGAGGASAGAGAGGAATCQYKEPATDFAPCATDSDCYSGLCDETGNPGPYCHIPMPGDIAALRGYTCATNDDCTKVLPADAVAKGLVGRCPGGDVYVGCSFTCSAQGSGSGASSGGTEEDATTGGSGSGEGSGSGSES